MTGTDEAIDLILGQVPHSLSIHLQDFIPNADEPGKGMNIPEIQNSHTIK